MDYEWAKPGVRCVCVDDSGRTSVVKDRIYTIVSIAPYLDPYGNVGFEIAGVVPVTHPLYFAAYRFKPLISKSLEEDTSEFRKLLNVEPMDATMFLLDILDKHVMEE